MIFIILHNQFIYQIYCLPTLFDKEPLNLSRRQIDCLIIYKDKGKFGFVHGSRGYTPTKALDKSISNKLYQNKYYDCNFNYFKDLLKENENIDISYNFIYSTLTKNGIYSPKIRKNQIF